MKAIGRHRLRSGRTQTAISNLITQASNLSVNNNNKAAGTNINAGSSSS